MHRLRRPPTNQTAKLHSPPPQASEPVFSRYKVRELKAAFESIHRFPGAERTSRYRTFIRYRLVNPMRGTCRRYEH
ncbi:hypothetical protein F2P81_024935 [Scophthalmus maximus]|uniref:Uncharacterized protein n=1 Tax=Scophthalmus maximus TaxID=52904 RepID=A0A6A4RWX6_SCOMX|nr:hypothetical protein F2P81_024935 [Scophthalmus maximus]